MTTNSASGDFTGPVTQIGTVHGDVYVSVDSPRDRYRYHVQTFAPARLIDRDEELAELTDFCTSASTAGTYLWWQADAWSGKSSLLSTFILRAPPTISIVSFFITASLPHQSTRRAFVENLYNQLSALPGTHSGQPLTESTREAQVRGMLAEAAHYCRDHGTQFVLVVDGLDEDRGVDGGPDAYSIAAMLPDHPPAGMRIIVSGRPHPPIPGDVPDHHPLRRPDIVRTLTPYAGAQIQRISIERDLTRMLKATPAEQDILGLVVAARGGLATRDLADLIRISPWQVDSHLRTAVGRSFVRITGGDPSTVTYRLAHEQLDVLAQDMLDTRLADYRHRLHAWAEGYASRRWPVDTPAYLLGGYVGMLAETADLPRMLACATDPYRHHRLRSMTGGDGAALGEITTTQNMLLRGPELDFVALARLAIHRLHLYRSSSQLPPTLPTGWARVGQFPRAESLIDSIADPVTRIDALLALADLCHHLGDTRRTTDLLGQADERVRTFNQFWGARPVHSVAGTYAETGDHEHAEQLAHLIKNTDERAEALASLACQAMDADQRARAEALSTTAQTLIRSHDARRPGVALCALAVVASTMDNPVVATALLDEAAATFQSDPADLVVQSDIGPAARYAALAGHPDQALRWVEMIEDDDRHEHWLQSVMWETARADAQRGEDIARTTLDPADLSERLALVASAIFRRDLDGAVRLVRDADSAAEQVRDSTRQREARMTVAMAMVEVGQVDQAMAIARDYGTSGTNGEAVLAVARALLRANDLERGADLLVLTEKVARRCARPDDERRSVLWIRTMAYAGDFDRAERHTRDLLDPSARSTAWAVIAEGAVTAGLLDRAEQALSCINDPTFQPQPLMDLVHALAVAGEAHRAIGIARGAAKPVIRAEALALIARETHRSDLLDEVEHLVGTFSSLGDQMRVLLVVVEAAACERDRTRAMRAIGLVRSVAQAIVDAPDQYDYPEKSVAATVIRLYSARIRTLAKVAAAARYAQHGYMIGSSDVVDEVLPVRTTAFNTQDLTPDQALAAQLSTEDWYHVVDQLVERCPETYLAITTELDTIASAIPSSGEVLD